MRIEPEDISLRLARYLKKANRPDLIESGLTISDDSFSHSLKFFPEDIDQAIIHSLFDAGAAHNALEPLKWTETTWRYVRNVPLLHVLLLIIILLLVVQDAKCQGQPRLILQGIAAGTPVPDSLATAGPWNIDCGAGTTWSATTQTLECPGSGGGGTPGGSSGQFQTNDSGAFAGSDLYIDFSTGFVGVGQPTPTAPLDILSTGANDSTVLLLEGNIPTLSYNDTSGDNQMNFTGAIFNFVGAATNVGSSFYMISGTDPINNSQVQMGMGTANNFIIAPYSGNNSTISPTIDFANSSANQAMIRFDPTNGGVIIGADYITGIGSVSPTNGLSVEGSIMIPAQQASSATPAILCIDDAGNILKGTLATCTGS